MSGEKGEAFVLQQLDLEANDDDDDNDDIDDDDGNDIYAHSANISFYQIKIYQIHASLWQIRNKTNLQYKLQVKI